MDKPKFSLVPHKRYFLDVVKETDKKTLSIWSIDCVKRVIHYFEEKYPEDNRPRYAMKTLQEWIKTGNFSMKVIRKASLDAHAAAREVGEDNSARSAARAAGQAVATAHVLTHAIGGAIYALQAVHRDVNKSEADMMIERDWQYKHLLELRGKLN